VHSVQLLRSQACAPLLTTKKSENIFVKKKMIERRRLYILSLKQSKRKPTINGAQQKNFAGDGGDRIHGNRERKERAARVPHTHTHKTKKKKKNCTSAVL